MAAEATDRRRVQGIEANLVSISVSIQKENTAVVFTTPKKDIKI